MNSLFSLIWGLIVFVFWVVVIVGGISLFYFNKLKQLKEAVRRRRANVGAAIQKKANILNKAQEALKGHQGFEQVTYLKISQDNTTAALASAYQQTNAMMASIQGMAQRFPEFQTSGIYKELMADSRKVNEDIETRQLELTQAIDDYNVRRGGMPCVLFAGFLGFKREEYPQFDVQGLDIAVGEVKAMESQDEERVEELLRGAGTHILGATKVLANQAGQAGKALAAGAGQAGKLISERIKEKTAAPKYFYMQPGGVPRGPATREELKVLIAQGVIQNDAILSEVGSQEWKPLPSFSAEWESPRLGEANPIEPAGPSPSVGD